MTRSIRNFLQDEDGAVVVDWVLMTASVVALCLAVLTVIGTSVNVLSHDIADTVINATF